MQIKRMKFRLDLRTLLATAIALGALMIVTARAAQAADDPGAVVKGLVNEALPVLADKQTALPQRQEKLRSIVNSRFDFTSMSKIALGAHWKDLSQQQQKEFSDTFTAFIQDSYLRKIQDYTGQKVKFLNATTPDPGYAQVDTQIIQEGKEPIPVNYMLKQVNGTWLVYDVTVDNISIIANYRNQFNRVINQQGYDKLISDLKSKQ